MTRISLPFLLFFGYTTFLFSNNINVENVTMVNATATEVMVEFDLSWDNSWRLSVGPANWDAAWVFVKYSAMDGSGPWHHATLNYVDGTNDGHTAATGSTITTSSDSKGVFIYRDADGNGTNTWTDIQLQWNFAADGVTDIAPAVIQVFAIEMVYVPQGEFAVGSGGGEPSRFTITTINTADARAVPAGTGNLGGLAGGYPSNMSPPNNATYPNGYNAFYLMKYEMSEEQWVAFFNTLTLAQQVNLDITSNQGKDTDDEVFRNTISWTTGFATTAVPNRACNYMHSNFIRCYLDWAALRPISEMEFEKACRGANQLPVANEYIWGTTGLTSTAFTFADDAMPNSTITNLMDSPTHGTGAYNSTMSGTSGALRCGIFAASAPAASRINTGAAYYGIMEMGGNLNEPVINISSTSGRNFIGTHGDGQLPSNGLTDISEWAGLGTKGGSWQDGSGSLRISDRDDVGSLNSAIIMGLRGGRTVE